MTIHGVHGYHEGAAKAELEDRLGAVVLEQSNVIANLDTRKKIPFNSDSDFDAEGRLLDTAPSFSAFIRH